MFAWLLCVAIDTSTSFFFLTEQKERRIKYRWWKLVTPTFLLYEPCFFLTSETLGTNIKSRSAGIKFSFVKVTELCSMSNTAFAESWYMKLNSNSANIKEDLIFIITGSFVVLR